MKSKPQQAPYKWGEREGHGKRAIDTLGTLIWGAFMHQCEQEGTSEIFKKSPEEILTVLIEVQNITAEVKDIEEAVTRLKHFFPTPLILAVA